MKTIMKKMKKIFAVLIALVMVLGMSTMAFGEDEPTTGSITVKNATKGHTYTAYKVFDATYVEGSNPLKVSYKTPAANASKLDDTLFGWSAADKDGNISVWALEDASEEDILDWVKENYDKFGGTAITGTFDDANSTVTFSNLAFGYYYITSSLGTAVTINSAVPTQDVYDKNEVTPVDPAKTIVSVDGTEQNKVTSANAHVGSVVGFKVTAKTTNWIDKDTIREAWTFTDTPTNMTLDLDSLVVNFNGDELTIGDDYTASIDDDGKLSINVPMVDANGNSVFEAPKTTDPEDPENGLIPIEITYEATIDATAADAPAKNEIPGDNPPPPPVVVYTYAFQVAKTDGTDPLPGAQFELWANGAALTFIDNGDGTYTYSPSGTVTTLDMTENTTIVVKGLDTNWDYTLKEITVPEGYNPAEDIDIDGEDLTKVTETVITVDGEETTTVVDTSVTSTELYKETVVNKAGTVLPTTGGIGTTIFYILGSLLVVGCGIVLVSRKRMQNNK